LKEKNNQEHDKKKTTIKRINIVFDIKTKQNQIKMDKIKKKTI
jgi:hypothetical protein